MQRAPRHALVVDDRPAERAAIAAALSGEGVVTREAGDVDQTRRLLRDLPPAVVVVRFDLPGGGATAVCREVAAIPGPRPHVLAVSGPGGGGGGLLAALDAGADDHVDLPAQPGELVARVRMGFRANTVRTAMEMAERALDARASEARVVLRSMREGVLVTTPDGCILAANPAFLAAVGWTESQVVGVAPPYPWWPPEHREEITAAMREARRAGTGELSTVFMRPSGARVPVEVTLTTMPHADGSVRGHVAVVRDVTSRVRMEKRLLASERAQGALGRVAMAVARGTEEGELYGLIAQQVARALDVECAMVVRYRAESAVVVGAHGDTRAHGAGTVVPREGPGALTPDDVAGTLPGAHIATTLAWFSGGVWGVVIAVTRRTSGLPEDAEHRLGGFAQMLSLDAANREMQRRLVAEATTDPLTGIANRRLFEERLDQEILRAARTGTPLSIAVVDIDHFKRINDEQGHGAGDLVLTGFAGVLRRCAREHEVVARVGGEEFAWLLPDTPQAGALRASERLLEAVAAHEFPPVGRVTCSAGVATLQPGETTGQLLRRADMALYAAKNAGRNRVEQAGPRMVRAA